MKKLYLALVLCLLTGFTEVDAYSTVLPEPGLIAYYPLDNNANDLSGNSHDGVVQGNVLYEEGVVGGSAVFDGASLIRIANFFPTISDFPVTFSAWFKTNTNKTGAHILSQWTTCGNPYGSLPSADDHFSISIYNHTSSGNFYLESYRMVDSYNKLPRTEVVDGLWHQVVVTYDASGASHLYLDGVLKSVDLTSSPKTFDSRVDFVIGGVHKFLSQCAPGDGFETFFVGNIDDVKVYNYALSEVEVIEKYEHVIDGNTNDPENPYPLYTQVVSPNPSIEETSAWANDTMPCGTIAACGCAITSLIMAGRGAGIETDILGGDVNPGNINEYLKLVDGYTNAGMVRWLAGQAYLGEMTSSGKIASRFSAPAMHTEENFQMSYVDDALAAGSKAVLGYDNGHFVWVTEKATDGYLLNDPNWYETKTANDTVVSGETLKRDYGNDFDYARIFTIYDEPVELTDGIEVHLKGTAELLYKNALGEQVGFVDGVVVLDLSGASYGDLENISLTGEIDEEGRHLIVPDADNTFTLEVIGTGVGEYEMEFYALSAIGEVTSFDLSGLTIPGVTTTFSFDLETGEVVEQPISYEQFLVISDTVLGDLSPQQRAFFAKWAEKMFEDMEEKTVTQALQTIDVFRKLLVAKKVDAPIVMTVLDKLQAQVGKE